MKLQTICEEWQKELRLQDWIIKVRFARIQDMDGTTHFGNIQYSQHYRRGSIKVLCENDFDPNATVVPYDAERTIVHELLHIHFDVTELDSNSPEGRALEVALNMTAEALVNLKRKLCVNTVKK